MHGLCGSSSSALEHHYDAADIEELKAAQLAGQLVFNDPEATQDEADAATYAILDVLAKLSKTADVKSLESLMEAAKTLAESGKQTTDSATALEEALNQAAAVLQ